TEVWNDLGFMRTGIASPINENSFRFSMDERLADDVWIEVYYGAARMGMELTQLTFPVTGKKANHAYEFHFLETEKQETLIEVLGNKVCFSGKSTSMKNAVAYFFKEKHWRNKGHHGCWEHVEQDNVEEVLFEEEWHHLGEVNELENLLVDHEKELEKAKYITIFISDTTEYRQKLKKALTEKYQAEEINVYAAFKP